MRPTQAALILGLLAALAFVIWFAARVEGGGPKVAGPAPLESLVREAARAEGTGELPVVTPDAEGAGGTERSALAAPPAPGEGTSAAPRAPGRIRGRAVDGDGTAIAGARVVAAAARGMGLVVLDQLAAEDLPWIQRVSATSAEDGRFELDALPGDALRVAVRAPGYAPLRTERALGGAQRDELGDLCLERGVVLSGRVVDASGSAVPEAEIHALERESGGIVFAVNRSRGTLVATTDEAGRFEVDEIAAGPYRLSVRHPEHPDALEEGQTDVPGEVRSGLLIRLEEGFAIAGRVLGMDPEDADTLKVRARALEADGANELRFDGDRDAPVERDGAFRLRGLRGAREYLVKVVDAEFGPFDEERSAAVVAAPGETDVVLQLVGGLALVGRVVDARTEAPVERFLLEAGAAWLSPQTDPEGNPVEEHPGGLFRYESVETQVERQPLTVRVRADGYATFTLKDLPIPADRLVDVGVVRLEPVPYVLVHVVDAATDAPVPGARVLLAPELPTHGSEAAAPALAVEGDELQQAVADESGVARVTSLPGRRCILRVEHTDFAPFASEPIDLPAAGASEQRVRMLRGGTVEVLVLDRAGAPVAGVSVERRGPDGLAGSFQPFGAETPSDAEGRVSFEHLVAGPHSFRLLDEGERGGIAGGDFFVHFGGEDEAGAEWIEVRAGEGTRERLTLTLPPRGSLHGEVSEAGKPLPGATLALEDPAGRGPVLLGLGGGPRTTSDGRGAYLFEDVRAGEWRLRVSHPSRAMDALIPLQVAEGDNELDVALDLAVIEGLVSDEEGRPVAGASVEVRRAAGAGDDDAGRQGVLVLEGNGISIRSGSASTTRTGEDGRYQLRGVHTGVQLEIEVRADGCQPARSAPLELRPGETRAGVDVRLTFGGQVEVLVVDAAGLPAGFVLVSAEYAGEGGTEVEDAREFVQEGGRAYFQGLVPGAWRFSARSVAFGDEANAELGAEPVLVEVVPRETREVRLELR